MAVEVVPLCNLCRARNADGALDGQLLCADCADDLLERAELAASLPRGFELPPLHPRFEPRRRWSGVSELALADPERPELGTVGEQSPERWLALNGYYGLDKQRQAVGDPDWDFPAE